ncbi:MAG: acyl-[acyl-carrier-protein] thioesterase [Marinifilaceae bacterium]
MDIGIQTETFRVINHFTDFKGDLFLRVLCDIFNDVAEMQTVKFGVDAPSLIKEGMTWMLHRLHLKLNRFPHKGEIITIDTWPSGSDRLFALRDYRVTDAQRNILVEGTSEWMLVDMVRRRPMRLTEKIIAMRDSANVAKIKMDYLIDRDTEVITNQGRPFIASYDNIDFNGHVTQASYVSWITNALPFHFLSKRSLCEMEIIYEHEIMPDSEIRSSYVITHEDETCVEMLHKVSSNNDEVTHCKAKTIWNKLN